MGTCVYPNSRLQIAPLVIYWWCYRRCLCLSTVSVARNIPIASAVWYCTELEPLLKISHCSGCQYKDSRSENISLIREPLPDKQELISFHETKHFTNLSGCTGTEFKAELWFASAFSRERRPVLLAVRWAADCIACSALHRPLRWRWERITGQQPSESTWRLLSWAH